MVLQLLLVVFGQVRSQAIAPSAPHGAPSAMSPAPGPGVRFAIEAGCLLLFAGSLHHESWRFGGCEKPVSVPVQSHQSQLNQIGS